MDASGNSKGVPFVLTPSEIEARTRLFQNLLMQQYSRGSSWFGGSASFIVTIKFAIYLTINVCEFIA